MGPCCARRFRQRRHFLGANHDGDGVLKTMNELRRRRKRAQSLVIVALSATALFGIIALGLDAGRLYFQRRDVQNAADAGALAGAQELLPSDGTAGVSATMVAKGGCQAAIFALQNLLDTPNA